MRGLRGKMKINRSTMILLIVLGVLLAVFVNLYEENQRYEKYLSERLFNLSSPVNSAIYEIDKILEKNESDFSIEDYESLIFYYNIITKNVQDMEYLASKLDKEKYQGELRNIPAQFSNQTSFFLFKKVDSIKQGNSNLSNNDAGKLQRMREVNSKWINIFEKYSVSEKLKDWGQNGKAINEAYWVELLYDLSNSTSLTDIGEMRY